MKKLRDVFKSFIVYSAIFSLVQTSVIFSAHAQMSDTTRAVLGAAQVGINTWAQAQAQGTQLKIQLAQEAAKAKMLQSLGPNCVTNGTNQPCHSVAGKFFPECKLPPTVAALPQNACNQRPGDLNQAAGQIPSLYGYEELAKAWVNHYDLQLNTASNAAIPTGIKCLEDKKKALDSQLIEMVNNITRMQEKFNQFKQAFNNNPQNQKMLKDLATMNDELLGANGSGKNNLDLKTKNFGSYFSQSCQSIIGEEGIANGPQTGLIGVMKNLAPSGKRASDYNSNRAAIENELRTDISKIQNSISSGGLQDYFDGKIADTSKYKSLVAATQKQATEFKIAQERITKELAQLNYKIPSMGKDFSVDFNEFVSVSKNYFKKQYINDCITGADKTVLGMSMEQLLGSLQQRSTNNTGTARNSYKAAIEQILQSDDFADAKLRKIEALQGTYKDISVSYQSSSGQTVIETPYDFFNKALSKCEARYAQDDQATSTGSNGVSHKKKVERGQALLKEFQNLHDNYSANLASRVLDQVLSCNGETKKSGASCGDPDSFDHTSTSFCMSHANQCANEVAGCMAEATKHVEVRKENMKKIAEAFNKNAQALRNQANLIYTNQRNAVEELVKTIQARFPGTNFAIPENMFIPELTFKSDTYGIDLASDGTVAFMDEMPKKLELLKKMFKDQQTKVDGEIEDYISKQMAAMEKQKARWNELADQCHDMAEGLKKDIATANSKGMEAQAKQDQQVGAYCRKYANLRENPLAACEDAKSLADDADKIAARLTNGALRYSAQFRNICNQYNNEALTLDDDCSNPESSEFQKLGNAKKARCLAQYNAQTKRMEAENGRNGQKYSRISVGSFCGENTSNEDFIKAVAKKLPEEDQDILKDLKELKEVSAKSDNLSPYAYGFFTNLQKIPGLKKTDNICAQLVKIDNQDGVPPKDYEKAVESETEKITKADAEIEKLAKEKREKDIIASDDAKKPEERASAGKAAKELGESINKQNTIKTAANTKLNEYEKLRGKSVLKLSIDSLTPAPLTKNEMRDQELRRIGQLADADGSCDSQASNVNMNKSFGIEAQINAFDRQFMGATR